MTSVDPQAGIAVNVGVCLNRRRQIRKMQRHTHDILTTLVGDRRRSGVWWLQFHGREVAAPALEQFFPDPIPADLAYLDRIHTILNAHPDDTVLVVAACWVDSEVAA